MITIAEIARIAGVSRYTASKVLNHDMTVKEATRTKILKICEEHGYIPNLNAINLVRGRSPLIGMIVPYITDGFYSMMIQNMEVEAEKLGFHLLYKSYYNDPKLEAKTIRTMLSLNVCGLFVVPAVIGIDKKTHQLAAKNIPVIYLDRPLSGNHCCILNDNTASARTMTEHLLKQTPSGDVVFLDSSYGESNPTAVARRKGYEIAMKKHGFTPKIIPASGNSNLQDSEQYAYERLTEFFQAGNRCKSLFCVTDASAFGAEKAAREAGLNPGKDFFIGGHDNLPFSAYSNPPITTMTQPIPQICSKALEILLSMLDGAPDPQQHFMFSSELTIRKSAGEM
ncbi:MAG: LacI family DNA-binding transcriptional regulator [Lentisphaeria bacterium]|nr:LacI family DNA-binding transcriptional regulator [Lentisphaeria bacterium]